MPNGAPHALAYITLRWMVREIVKSGCGIQFEEDAINRLNIDLASDETETLDDQDAVQPMHDELKSNPLWWLLEIVPLTYTWQDTDGTWKSKLGCVMLLKSGEKQS